MPMCEGRARAIPSPGLWVRRLGVEEEDSPSLSINVSQVDLEQSIIKAEETFAGGRRRINSSNRSPPSAASQSAIAKSQFQHATCG